MAQIAPGAGPAESQGPEGRHVRIDGKQYRVGPYWGPECEQIGIEKKQIWQGDKEAEPIVGKQVNLTHEPLEGIFRMVCAEKILSSHAEPEQNTWTMQHFRFDELAFDHMTAALMLVQCLKADSCLGEGAPFHWVELHNSIGEQRQREQMNAPKEVSELYQIGMMRWYAERVDVRVVAAALQKLPLPPAAVQAFMTQLDKAKLRVVQVSDQLVPDAKRIFVDIPAAVHQQREADFAKHQPILAELAQLTEQSKGERTAGGTSDATLDKLRKLRVTYHASCKTDCTKGPIFAAITKQLFWAYASRGDAPGATAEAKLLEHLDPTAAMDIATKQEAAVEKQRGRVDRVSRAREQGLDADTARSTATGTLIDYGDGRYVYSWKSEYDIHYDSLVPDGHEVGHMGGKVAGLEKRGANVLVRFADEVSTYSEDTDCYETNRIDGIDSNGKLIYREACRGTTTKVERHKVDPVMIPAREAANLHGGDEIVGFARGTGEQRLGTIWLVKRGQKVTRLREIPM